MTHESLRSVGKPEEDAHHILADSSLTDERIRVLKHGDTFALFDQYGDIRPSKAGEQGVYHDGTRFLSRLILELDGRRPFFLSSTVRDDNDQLTVALTNPDLCRDGVVYLPLGTLHLAVKKFLWQGALHQEIQIQNHGVQSADATVTIQVGADFADIYEVRGLKREARGEDLEPIASLNRVTLRYRGLDLTVRRTVLQFTPSPNRLTAGCAEFTVALAPKETASFQLVVGCESGPEGRPLLAFDQARVEAKADLGRHKAQLCRIESVNGQFNALVQRAASDLHMMITTLPSGPYPYAGVPWFNAPFGRDGIITALECLWFHPSLARGVLAYLASTQATEVIPGQDAEPGKILHETRNGEMAALGEMPFGCSLCWQARTLSELVTLGSLRGSGLTSRPRCSGWIVTAIETATDSLNTIDSRATGFCTRAGRTLTTPSSMPTAHPLKGRSPYVKCRAMPTPPGGQVQPWPRPSAGQGRPRISYLGP
jgi:glycogen debranching enzyme